MKREELSALVLNAIRDAKTIVENYEYFRQQENTGLWKDLNNAEAYISSFYSYYNAGNKEAVEEIRDYLSQYYLPFVEVFSEPENRNMKIARRIGSIGWKGAAFGAALTLADNGFLAPTLTMLIATLSAYGYARSMRKSRKKLLDEFRKLNAEAGAIAKDELEAILKEDEKLIKEKLSASYGFDNL